MTYKKAVQRKEYLLNAPDSPEENGYSPSERKKPKKGRTRDSSGGGIERYFGGKGGNGIDKEVASSEDRMDVDD